MSLLCVLVTGANGFIGSSLVERLAVQGYSVVAAVRKQHDSSFRANGVKVVAVGNVDAHTDWQPALANVKVVVHLAARAHILSETEADALSVYRAVNRDGTLHMARMAARAGVRRFVFVSSIGVNGNQTDALAFSDQDPPAPHNDYALSKWEAEQGLHTISAETGMEVVILRPPLVYGPGVKANFLRLMQLVERGWPLPLGAVHNRRSLIYLGNLISAIAVCLEHPAAAGKTFLVSDGEDVSTPDLIRLIAGEMGRPARLLPVPAPLIRLFAVAVGKRAEADRLLGSLVIDGSKLMDECGWRPPYSLHEGIRETVRVYRGGWVVDLSHRKK